MSINPQTQMGLVSLTVSDLARSLAYYQQVIGLSVLQNDGRTAVLGVGENKSLLRLHQLDAPKTATQPSTGLFHFALLLPTRRDLALTLRHLASLNMTRLGASDHLVSEALYLDDPDGHGIEIYADRPRESWSFTNGRLQMATKRLNSQELLGEISDADQWGGLPDGTTMGHVHLRVGDIAQAKAFYLDIVGFDGMVDYNNVASFASAGGYHHHLGMNVWDSAGADPAPADVPKLDYFTILVPDEAAQTAVVTRLVDANIPVIERGDAHFFRDPFENQVALAVAA